jgi:hypothetical protein
MADARRRMRLTWTNTGVSTVAELLEDEAPQTCKYVWDLLPLEQEAGHSKYSNSEIVVPVQNPQKPARENRMQMPLPGELLYFYESRITSRGKLEEVGHVRIVYGRGILFRDMEGIPSFGVLFARIPGDWKYDWQPFAEACRTLHEGAAQNLRIERVEE